MKKEKAQSKKQEEVNEAPAPSAPATKTSRKPIVIEEENSESVWDLKIWLYHIILWLKIKIDYFTLRIMINLLVQ